MRYLTFFVCLWVITSAFGQKELREMPPEVLRGDVDDQIVVNGDTAKNKIIFAYFTENWPAYKDSANHLIYEFVESSTQFGVEYGLESELNSEYFKAQLDTFAQICHDENELNDIGRAWEIELVIYIDNDRSNFVTVSLAEWKYTGGAHGNFFTGYHHLDVPTGRKLGLKDFFVDINALNKVAEPYFRKEAGLESDDNLADAGYWFEDNAFMVPDNFTFNGQEVVFLYNIYEIGPYSAGATELSIPLKEIEDLILIPIY